MNTSGTCEAKSAACPFHRDGQHPAVTQRLQGEANGVEIKFATPYGDRVPGDGQETQNRIVPRFLFGQRSHFTRYYRIQIRVKEVDVINGQDNWS